MRVFNSLTQRVEELLPIEPGHVRFYTCGPTVYNFAHIGNYRAYIFEDLLRRTLKYFGLRVTQVMNLTDVDDKTIRGARAAGTPLKSFTQPYRDAFFADLRTLAIEPAEHYPAATDHIPEMIALIARLFEKGVAYRSADGSIYFRIAAFPEYGKLAHLDRGGLQAGARVAQDEYDKENAADFALWKAWDEQDGEIAWDSPWGRGRPGWHIECTAMSMKYLGESFDLHTGGIDNLFPHHEDELAQAEAATGKPFVRTWMHCAHLVVEGRKMSKSLGNFYTLRDVLARGYSGREMRLALIGAHYRQSLDFSFVALDAARASLQRLDAFRARLAGLAADKAAAVPPPWAVQAETAFGVALADDLGIAEALAALFTLVTAGNRALDANQVAPADAAAVLALLARLDAVLGFLEPEATVAPPEMLALLDARQAARKSKNWAEADRLRQEIAAQGWVIEDTPKGPRLKKG